MTSKVAVTLASLTLLAPTLLNIAVTAPYMHDGSVATLEEAILITMQQAAGPSRTVPIAESAMTIPTRARQFAAFR
jgi:cytochrome c peroxidase